MRNGFFREKERKARLPKTAALIVSLGCHILLISVLYHAKITVKILGLRPDVRKVVIVSPNKLIVPGPIENFIQHMPSSNPLGMDKKTSRTRRAADSAEGKTDSEGRALDYGLKNSPGSENEGRSSSAPLLGRGLDLSSRFQNAENGDPSVNLSAVPDRIDEAPLGFEKKTGQSGSFRKYVHSGRLGGSDGKGAGRGAGARGGGSRARASFLSAGYDISPWARKALDLIQLNWIIPGVRDITGKSEVRISVVIEKNGLFSSFEVLDKSNLELQTSAAVNSLLSSLPLPRLPDDFPAVNLPAFFVFTYDN